MAKHEKNIGVPSLVILKVNDEKELKQTLTAVAQEGIKCYAFIEPYFGNSMTAFATRPVNNEERKFFKSYQLW